MIKNVQNSPAIEAPVVSEISQQQQIGFKNNLTKLLGINALGFGLSVGNEAISHSALGFTQATMEGVDSAMAVGLGVSHKYDVAGNHAAASRIRQGLYSSHIAIAGIGIFESARLMHESSQPTLANVAISGLVAVLNMHYLRHRRKHRENTAHTKTPTIEIAYQDPLEVVQEETSKKLSPAEKHQLNEDGITAIAKTNIVESVGGLLGAGSYVLYEQGPATAAIVSSFGVVYIMLRQIVQDRRATALATA